MRVIGTAGHVDHGKSTLVAALTGIHPDRLKEEKEREMTIDLGFAWMDLPGGEAVGIIDVPGHRDFIENMLAGVGGIDAALFVIAADEGIMPQTREHLAILDLLEIPAGVIALTKIDLIDDPEWLDLVESDVRNILKGTCLESAPVARVSARNGEGLAELIKKLTDVLHAQPKRNDLGKPRLPIDRIFSITGFGTIVTGTLLDGKLKSGDEIEILPQGIKTRIRGLQTHKTKEEVAIPGSRVAANLSGVEVGEIRRGDVLVKPGQYKVTKRLDMSFKLLADASAPLEHDTEVKLFLGPQESSARVRVIGAERLMPGEPGWLQVEPEREMIAARRDRFILRRPSPGETLGGGEVIDPHPSKRHKRFSKDIISQFEASLLGSPQDLLLQASQSLGISRFVDLFTKARLDEEIAIVAGTQMMVEGTLIIINGNTSALSRDALVISSTLWQTKLDKMRVILQKFHRDFPLRPGMPREEFRSKANFSSSLFSTILNRLVNDGLLLDLGSSIALAGHQVKLTPEQQARTDGLLARFRTNPLAPPSVKEALTEIGEDLLAVLTGQGKLIQLSEEVLLDGQEYQRWLGKLEEFLAKSQQITVAEFRDLVGTSRKYALAYLEYLDGKGITQRDGDQRSLRAPR